MLKHDGGLLQQSDCPSSSLRQEIYLEQSYLIIILFISIKKITITTKTRAWPTAIYSTGAHTCDAVHDLCAGNKHGTLAQAAEWKSAAI